MLICAGNMGIELSAPGCREHSWTKHRVASTFLSSDTTLVVVSRSPKSHQVDFDRRTSSETRNRCFKWGGSTQLKMCQTGFQSCPGAFWSSKRHLHLPWASALFCALALSLSSFLCTCLEHQLFFVHLPWASACVTCLEPQLFFVHLHLNLSSFLCTCYTNMQPELLRITSPNSLL